MGLQTTLIKNPNLHNGLQGAKFEFNIGSVGSTSSYDEEPNEIVASTFIQK
jgi:hypothetical protein